MTKRRSLGVLLAGVVIAVTCAAFAAAQLVGAVHSAAPQRVPGRGLAGGLCFVVGLILLIVTHRRNPRRAPLADTAAQGGDGPGQWPVRKS